MTMLESIMEASGSGRHAGRKYYGKYPGFVVDRAPESAAGHHRGMLKVRVPAILEEDTSGGERALEAVASPAFMPGLYWVPEVGDSVWVEFAAGDVEYPIWTGVWYAVDAAPASLDGNQPTEDQKMVRTPSGQLVYLEDTGGSERLVLEDGAHSNRITMDANGIKLEAAGCTIELTTSKLRLTNGTHTIELGATAATLDFAGNGAQPFVLAPLLDWLQTHQHVGNMGAPTPLFPADIVTLQIPVPPKKSGL